MAPIIVAILLASVKLKSIKKACTREIRYKTLLFEFHVNICLTLAVKNVTKPQPPKKDIIPIQNNVIPADASDKKRSSESESSDNKKQKVDINDETESTKAKKDCSQKVEDLASVIQKAIKEILTEKAKMKFSKLQSKVGKKVKKAADNLSKEDALKAVEKHILEALKKDEFTLSLQN
ncbi:hypothetical protein DSO57_1029721 [Entomophthora muscae]|uniref:Uncharacterized protein n=1 Tax=Entomophthora muscae TaxID=34485 RepID=A0ACC2TN89_9FUNG|nr:hypothetical protein DSO57_1029721 [Entomophthora muscae]